MSWPVYLLVACGCGVIVSQSDVFGPARIVVAGLLRRIDLYLAGRVGWWPDPWLSEAPQCAVCVTFWAGLALALAGYGPDDGTPALLAGAGAAGLTWGLVPFAKRAARGLD